MRVPRSKSLKTEYPPLERVYAVIFGLSHPTDLSYIADCAGLSHETTHDQLTTLSELGIVSTYSYDPTTLYGFSDKYLNDRALWRLCTERSLSELNKMEEQLTAHLTRWRDKYDLSSAVETISVNRSRASLPPLIRGEWLFLNHYRDLIRQAQRLASL